MAEVTKHNCKIEEALEVGEEIYQTYKDKPFYGIIFIARGRTEDGFIFGELTKTLNHRLLALMLDAINSSIQDGVVDIVAAEIIDAIDRASKEDGKEN